jgi:hypothetical protein
MELSEYDDKKNKLIEYIEKLGIDKDEVEKYIRKEIDESKGLGMTDMDSRTRALISAVNHYRKYLDKIGNRVKFLCLGVTQPTDYGLGGKVREIRKKWLDPSLRSDEKQDMIDKKIVNERGIPLHTSETTLFKDKEGTPINIDDEQQQQMIGVVTSDNGNFPAIVKVYGKTACNERKYQYQWCLISADQGVSKKYPTYISLNSRELLMKPLKNFPRITIKEYQEMVELFFADIIVDMNDLATIQRLEEPGTHLFLKNGRMMNLNLTPYGWMTELTSMKSIFDVSDPIIADIKIPSHLEMDVDPKRLDEMWLLVQPRERKLQDNRPKLDVLGMYVENPVDRSIHKINEGFMKEEDGNQSVSSGPDTQSREAKDFYEAMEKRNS